MPEDAQVGCARPTGGPVEEEPRETQQKTDSVKEERKMVMVGQKAPDFSAPGYQQGKFRNVNESIRQIQAFQLVRETGGAEATPSGWRPGKTTLKPGIDLVGRVWEVWKTNEASD